MSLRELVTWSRHMVGLDSIGKLLMLVGGGTALMGLVLLLIGRVPLLGKLPGDIVFQKGGLTFYFPIVTMLLISIVLTIVLNIVFRILR